MTKYHINFGIPKIVKQKAIELIIALNNRKLKFSNHSMEEIRQEKNPHEIRAFLIDYRLNFDNCFEIVIDNGRIQKLAFRTILNEKAVCFVISSDNCLITLWTNNKFDNHFALNPENYIVLS